MTTTTEKPVPASKRGASAPKFPREVTIVNETAMEYVVARTHLKAGSKVNVTVKDEDELTRIKTDCEHIVGLLDNYKEAELPPLRVVEAV